MGKVGLYEVFKKKMAHVHYILGTYRFKEFNLGKLFIVYSCIKGCLVSLFTHTTFM